ncbi:MAG: SGNH/GDSL hydrolase family protein [Myxococcota bacterium]
MRTPGGGGRGRAWLGSLALALAATGLALLAGELGLRLRGPAPPPAPRPAPPAELRDLPELKRLYDLRRPNARGVFKGVLHRTNSRGVRGPEFTPEPAPGVFRMVVLGDSYTMGQGVPEEQAYPVVAARLLEQRGPPRRVEAVNLGVSGLAIRHSVKRLRKVGLGYRPHLVVYGFTPNDIMGPDWVEPSAETKRASEALRRRFDDSPSLLLRTIWPRLVMLRSALWPLPGTYEHTLEENYFRNPAAVRQLHEGLDELARLSREAGVCGHVFVHTRMNQLWIHPFTRIYRLVAESARERGLGATVSHPHFRGRDVDALRHSVADTHPNAAGHRLHAEALVEGLSGLAPHCWRPGHYVPPDA